MSYIGIKQFNNSVILGREKKGGHWEKEEMARVGLKSDKISLNLVLLKSIGAQCFFSLQSLCSPCVRLTLNSSTLRKTNAHSKLSPMSA